MDQSHATAPPSRSRRSLFATFLVVILAGYALFGKGFAYIGAPPLFIGEVGLILAVAVLLFRFHSGLLQSPAVWLILLFIGWGAVRTLPYLGRDGIDALRDGVVWGYALFAIAVATVVIRFKLANEAVRAFGRAAPVFLIAAPLFLAAFWALEHSLPSWPWNPVTIIYVKAGDMAVHYAGILAFMLLGLSWRLSRIRWLALWMAGVLPVIFVSRGALVTVLFIVLLIAVLRPTLNVWGALVAGLVALLGLYVAGIQIDPGLPSGRMISVEQLVDSATSIIFPDEKVAGDLGGTRDWRLTWWENIAGYTFFGQHFWTGKGFGINLADADGFQVVDGTLRSPHSIHLTVLARMGVPGLAIWAALLVYLAARLGLDYLHDRATERRWLARVEFWTLLYWFAFLINASFDVFLEGPQGGIWFWSLTGFGIALTVIRSRLKTLAIRKPSTRVLHQTDVYAPQTAGSP